MNLRLCFTWISAIMLGFCPFAFASEDTPSPFPDDFYIADLPKLPEENNMPNYNATQLPSIDTPVDISNKTSSVSESEQIIPQESTITNVSLNQPVDVTPQTTESTENTPIFLPNNNNSSNENIEKTTAKVDQSLTDTLKSERKTNIIEGTWIEKLASVNPLSVFDSDTKNTDTENLEDLVIKSRSKDKDDRSNASVFDISGLMLRMNLNQVEKTMKNRGFQKIGAKFSIPNFIKWRNEESCSSQGVVGFERMQSCIKTLSKKDGHEYLYYLKYAKFESKEEIEVYLTSNFTENKVYKIIYRSKIAAIPGNSAKTIYMRNLKVYDFWKKINQKYGHPDNKTNVTWGLGGNKPFMRASTGFLHLEDPMFAEMDYTRMSREDQRYVHSDFYNF